MALPNNNDRVLIGPFPSKIKNTCTHCNGTVWQRDSIYYYKQRRTQEEINAGVPKKGLIVLHAACADLWITKQSESWQVVLPGHKAVSQANTDSIDTQDAVSDDSDAMPTPASTPANTDLLTLIAGAVLPLVQSQLKTKVDSEQVKSIVETAIDKALANFKTPVKRIELLNVKSGEVKDLGLQHKQFPQLLQASQARLDDGHRLNLYIGGPAGSGKSKAGEYVAKALGLDFAYTGSFNESHKIFGYVSPIDGKYHSTPFRDAYENGKAFMFDDFDGSDPVCAIELLGMLANGHAAFPDGMVARHPDHLCFISANTFGHGATSDYVGRLKQDKALLDRFVFFDWQYDEALETATSGNADWASRVQTLRANAARNGLKVLITPRATYKGAALLRAGFKQSEVESMVIGCTMTPEQWKSIR